MVVDRYGDMPSVNNPEAFSLWVAAVLPNEVGESAEAVSLTPVREDQVLVRRQAANGAGCDRRTAT